MRTVFLILMVTVFMIGFMSNVSADKTSEAYMKALERGDYNEVYRAQSYLAPLFCYDFNPLHGVTFVKSINGRVYKPAFPFIYQDMSHLKVRKLYGRAGIEGMVKKSKTELELIQHISDWANKHWGHMLPLPYPAWDAHEILDRAERGDSFFCTFKAVLFVQACNAAGLSARILGINPKHRDAHTVSEVYSNEFRKWMLVDPWKNCFYERDGIPLSAVDLHYSTNDPKGIYVVYGENGDGLEYWAFKTGKAKNIPHANARVPFEEDSSKNLLAYYYDIRAIMRNDHTVHPQQKENVYVDGFMVPYNPRGGEWWGPQLHWTDDATPLQITSWNTGKITEFEWTLNEVEVDLKKVSVSGEPVVLEAKFSTFTPSFSHYSMVIDGDTIPIDGDVYKWKLHKGTNSLKIASINTAGRSGFPSEFVIEYDPEKVDFTRKVTVEFKNPGMEVSDSKQSGGVRKPANWSTITSNPLIFREFTLDSKRKHSGKYSLKTTPVRDPETGVEYAFIVRSESFAVNPATDVIYSIWLRASKDNTQVDITLHDDSKWGLGIYVKRVTAGTSWKKYELKCRLHNENTRVFVGYKIYNGTVWADDASYVEVKR